MQADMVLEEYLRVLHLADNKKSTDSHTKGNLSIRDLKARLHNDPLPPTRPRLPVVPIPLGTTFFQTTAGCYLVSHHQLMHELVHMLIIS